MHKILIDVKQNSTYTVYDADLQKTAKLTRMKTKTIRIVADIIGDLISVFDIFSIDWTFNWSILQ